MTNKQLQEILRKYPDDLPILLFRGLSMKRAKAIPIIHEFTEENILDTSEGYFNEEGRWIENENDRKLLINPPIL